MGQFKFKILVDIYVYIICQKVSPPSGVEPKRQATFRAVGLSKI